MVQRLRATNLLPTVAPAHADKLTGEPAGEAAVVPAGEVRALVCVLHCVGPDAMPTATIRPLSDSLATSIVRGEGAIDNGAAVGGVGDTISAGADGGEGELRWALLEGGGGSGGRSADREADVVLLGAPAWLVARERDPPRGDGAVDEAAEAAAVGGTVVAVPRREASATSGEPPLLLPSPSNETRTIRQPASLLQKAIRRRAGALCSVAPLLDACAALLAPLTAAGPAAAAAATDGERRKTPLRGATAAMLTAVWGGMLADSSPFEPPSDGAALGIEQLLLLTLVARADPSWTMPPQLMRKAVAAALRAQARDANQWVGFVKTRRAGEAIFTVESAPGDAGCDSPVAPRVRNALRALHASSGFSFQFGTWGAFTGDRLSGAVWAYLKPEFSSWQQRLASEAVPGEASLLDNWCAGLPAPAVDARVGTLDEQCCLSAYDLSVSPAALLLLQALLPSPPDNWKRSSLPSLARHFRKLSAELNPRDQQRQLLARLEQMKATQEGGATDDVDDTAAVEPAAGGGTSGALVAAAEARAVREFAADTDLFDTLSPKEEQLLERIREVQSYLRAHGSSDGVGVDRLNGVGCLTKGVLEASPEAGEPGKAWPMVAMRHVRVRESAGGALSEHDGRSGFLLAFGFVVELQVTGLAGKEETVGVLFAGSESEPLLVQRVGRGRDEAAAAADGPQAGASGASAAPQLGYVSHRELTQDMGEREREAAAADAALYQAALKAAAAHWAGGVRRALPLPPRGLQWSLGAAAGEEEAAEADTTLTAEYDEGRRAWSFTIGGVQVRPLDARAALSPCSAPSEVAPLHEGSSMHALICRALYAHPHEKHEGNTPWAAADGGERVAAALGLRRGLELFERLHGAAVASRAAGAREGFVYEWAGLAARGAVSASVWRDALLAITTREAEHVVLGPINTDGSGSGRDMSEGVLYRILHALEALYPSALVKEGPLKWRVVPRGAAYHHLITQLEGLGRSVVSPRPLLDAPLDVGVGASAGGGVPEGGDEMLELPQILSTLWPHQQRSVAATLAGVRVGKLGFADASTVGAGKTLTALATVVQIAAHLRERGVRRHGALVLLPEPSLIKEWLLELGKHTSGFHVVEQVRTPGARALPPLETGLRISRALSLASPLARAQRLTPTRAEQREDGSLFSLTYAKSHPPIDANTIVLSTLDRVSAHTFVRQAAWDFVVIDECLAVQNAAAKRCPSAWRQIEVSTAGVLMLSATFFRSKYASLFYMIRMLRSPLPRTLEFLPALIHEHIVCEVPETERTWAMEGDAVPLATVEMARYRQTIDAFERRRLNYGDADGAASTHPRPRPRANPRACAHTPHAARSCGRDEALGRSVHLPARASVGGARWHRRGPLRGEFSLGGGGGRAGAAAAQAGGATPRLCKHRGGEEPPAHRDAHPWSRRSHLGGGAAGVPPRRRVGR